MKPFWSLNSGGFHDRDMLVEVTNVMTTSCGGPVGTNVIEGKPVM